MDLSMTIVGLFLAVITLVESQDAQFNQGGSQPPVPGQNPQGHRSNFPAPPSMKEQAHDPNHIKEHYDGRLDAQENYTEDEMNFHYFKVHDYDNNNMLDGIELISALTHFHGNKDGPNEPRMPDQELTNMIDLILEDDDTNQDGYVDYPEFIMSQKR